MLEITVENKIVLSIIVRIVGGQALLHRCLGGLVPQVEERPIEIIVPYDSTVNGIDQSLQDYRQVTFVNIGAVRTDAPLASRTVFHELCDRRTSAGLAVARGQILALLEDTVVPSHDWCDQVFEAHQLPYGVIGGAVEQAGKGALNWAVYFQDFGRYQLPLREGPTDYLTDMNVSYKRQVLESARTLWSERYNEAAVHWALAREGIVLWLRPQIVVHQDRGKLVFSEQIVQRFWWGRLFGSVRVSEISFVMRLFYLVCGPIIPIILLGRMAYKVFGGRRNRVQFVRSLPYITVMTLAWCLGEFVGYVTARESPFGTSQMDRKRG